MKPSPTYKPQSPLDRYEIPLTCMDQRVRGEGPGTSDKKFLDNFFLQKGFNVLLQGKGKSFRRFQ